MKLSAYVLTFNSEKRISEVLNSLKDVADDIVVIDSGSHDRTEQIVLGLGVRWVSRGFDNFVNQRNFAQEQCLHDWVLFVDSDEVLEDALGAQINRLKANDFMIDGKVYEAYQLKRRWFILGKEVRAHYPISSPDFPIRIFLKTKVRFHSTSQLVHERPDGYNETYRLVDGSLLHYSIDSVEELFRKLNQYTTLAADDLMRRKKKAGLVRAFIHGVSAWLKWYFKKGSYRDGEVGFLLGLYAFLYTYLKYVKLYFRKA